MNSQHKLDESIQSRVSAVKKATLIQFVMIIIVVVTVAQQVVVGLRLGNDNIPGYIASKVLAMPAPINATSSKTILDWLSGDISSEIKAGELINIFGWSNIKLLWTSNYQVRLTILSNKLLDNFYNQHKGESCPIGPVVFVEVHDSIPRREWRPEFETTLGTDAYWKFFMDRRGVMIPEQEEIALVKPENLLKMGTHSYNDDLQKISKVLCSVVPYDAPTLHQILLLSAAAAGITTESSDVAIRGLLSAVYEPKAVVPMIELEFSGAALLYVLAIMSILVSMWIASQVRILALLPQVAGREPWFLLDPLIVIRTNFLNNPVANFLVTLLQIFELLAGILIQLVAVVAPILIVFVATNVSSALAWFSGSEHSAYRSLFSPLSGGMNYIIDGSAALGHFLLTIAIVVSFIQFAWIAVLFHRTWRERQSLELRLIETKKVPAAAGGIQNPEVHQRTPDD
jgi:hypothetical protein